MILIIDNYDSFTYNLVHAFGSLGAETAVYRNDKITVREALDLGADAIVVSPGPCTPKEAGISVELIRSVPEKMPLLGVCLGHQSIGAAFGAAVAGADSIMHGKTSMVSHFGDGLYKGLKNPFPAGRYHSLSIVKNTLPSELVIDAWTEDGEIMGIRHVGRPIYGVQFHPESVLTPSGKRLLRNFLQTTGAEL